MPAAVNPLRCNFGWAVALPLLVAGCAFEATPRQPVEVLLGESSCDAEQLGTIFVPLEENRVELTPEVDRLLDSVAATLRECPNIRVLIAGHTDERGSEELNFAIRSDELASSTAQLLEARSVELGRIETVGYGEGRPRVRGHTAAAWSANRRVEILVRCSRRDLFSSACPEEGATAKTRVED